MRLYKAIFTLLIFTISFWVNACRPPELEQAIIDYNGGRFDNAYNLVVKATEKHPDNEEAWYYLGEVQGKRGEIREMIESFDKSLAISNTYQNEINIAKRTYFNRFYNDGVSAYNALIKTEDKSSDEAKNQLDKIVSNFTQANYINNAYVTNRLLAIAYQVVGDDSNCLKYLNIAADVDPDTATAYIDLGYYYQRHQEFLKAAEQFKKGIDIDPDNSECLIRYAESLDMANEQEAAIDAYKAAIKVSPSEKAIPFNLGLLYFKRANSVEGDEAQKKKFMEEAVSYFEKAREIDPEIKEVYDLLGTLLLQLQQFEKAKEVLEQGVERFPESASVWQNLSFVYAKLGEQKKAEEAFEKSKQLQ
jgi:tetratricopeptide (TPR) repeat protein